MATRPHQLSSNVLGDAGKVDYPCLRDVQSLEPGGGRLQLSDVISVETTQTRQPIGCAPALQLVESTELGLLRCDHDLPRSSKRDGSRVTQALELGATLNAETGFERPGSVIEPGMEHAAVVTALVGADPFLLVEDENGCSLVLLQNSPSNTQADQPGADDADVVCQIFGSLKPDFSTT
jgi:hypothetical protein